MMVLGSPDSVTHEGYGNTSMFANDSIFTYLNIQNHPQALYISYPSWIEGFLNFATAFLKASQGAK